MDRDYFTKALTYCVSVLFMLLGICWLFVADGIRRYIAEGHSPSIARLRPWCRSAGLTFAIFGFVLLVLQLVGFIDWLNTP